MAETTAVPAPPAVKDALKTAEPPRSASAPSSAAPLGSAESTPPAKVPLNKIYALPAPIRTFPLPTFYPSNPISLLHLAYVWLSQVLRPPPREPVVHTGVWDPETRSVHIRDDSSIRALWEQGFYGKGSLSRSEPNWLKRELARRGSPEGKTVSEARTELRREERRLAKWERAKAELEALERQRLAEAASQAPASLASETNGVEGNHVETVEPLAPPSPVQVDVAEPNRAAEVNPADAAEIVTDTAPAVDEPPTCQPDGYTEGIRRTHRPPTRPAELLALPNSLAELNNLLNGFPSDPPNHSESVERKAPVGPAELLMLPNSHADLVARPVSGLAIFKIPQSIPSQPTLQATINGHGTSIGEPLKSLPEMNGAATGRPAKASDSTGEQDVQRELSNGSAARPAETSEGSPSHASLSSDAPLSSSSASETEKVPQTPKRRKSVRFSPTVESTTFLDSDPPSPNHSVNAARSVTPALPNEDGPATSRLFPQDASSLNGEVSSTSEIENKEHYQLAPEEAFFLTFSLGALRVVDPVTGSPISTEQLLALFRAYSYFPPRPVSPDGHGLRPDDPFLVNYAVYHHFRSLGWVPRHGIKFGVDWIIYQRGPVFDHSEFGIMVVPAYSDAAWEGEAHEEPRRSWSWLMGVNRVLSHVLKSLVLVYVDIPPPDVFDEQMKRGGIAAALKRYKIREVMVRRFSVNRNR